MYAVAGHQIIVLHLIGVIEKAPVHQV